MRKDTYTENHTVFYAANGTVTSIYIIKEENFRFNALIAIKKCRNNYGKHLFKSKLHILNKTAKLCQQSISGEIAVKTEKIKKG